MSTVAYPHIEVRANGKAYIKGTGYKVRILVEEYLAGAHPEEMEREHPPLTLSQIHGALTYYYDHKEEMDRETEELTRFAEELRAQQGESVLAKKLRELGKELP
jgi:uncharacterized protein (DUF433 family)